MGCFNVACSISSISIGEGTPCYFIPLIKKHHKSRKYMRANFPDGYGFMDSPKSIITYPDDIFTPLTLPILGKYNDYGSLDDIVQDNNVDAIEKFFGVPIDDIISCAACDKGIDNYTSTVYQTYCVHKKNMELFDSTYLINIGFEYSTEEGCFIHPHIKNAKLKIVPEKKYGQREASFVIFDKDFKIICELDKVYDPDSSLKSCFLKNFDYYLNIRQEDQERVSILYNMSGMFVHADIFNLMSKNKEIKKFATVIDMSKEYDNFVKEAKRYLKIDNKLKKAKKEDHLPILKELFSLGDPFSGLSHGAFIDIFKDWEYFKDIYAEPILKGTLKKQFISYTSFLMDMRKMNRIFFPACNGLQHGNPFASKRLLEKSLEIVNSEIARDAEDWDCEDEEFNESCYS